MIPFSSRWTAPPTEPYLSRSNGYSRGGARKYSLVIPIPEGRLYTGAQGTGMEYEHIHRFTAGSDAEAQEHAAAYLAKRAAKHDRT